MLETMLKILKNIKNSLIILILFSSNALAVGNLLLNMMELIHILITVEDQKIVMPMMEVNLLFEMEL